MCRAIVVHEPGQDRKVAALSEFAMCLTFFVLIFNKNILKIYVTFDKLDIWS